MERVLNPTDNSGNSFHASIFSCVLSMPRSNRCIIMSYFKPVFSVTLSAAKGIGLLNDYILRFAQNDLFMGREVLK